MSTRHTPCLGVIPVPIFSPQAEHPAVKVFMHYYDRLIHKAGDLESLVSKLYGKDLIDLEEMDRVIDHNEHPLVKVKAILSAVEYRITAEQSSQSLRRFCRVICKHSGLRSLSDKMINKLGEHVFAKQSLSCCIINSVDNEHVEFLQYFCTFVSTKYCNYIIFLTA